jgi:hypothetical protein
MNYVEEIQQLLNPNQEPLTGQIPAEEPPLEATPNDVMVVMPAAVQMTAGQHRVKLLLDGVCTRCAHCALELTDAVSQERGIGPICSKHGYLEDPKDSDEVQAMIDLAAYPELVSYLNEHWKPKGVRGLMNGLVRIASLNRRTPVHEACTDAIASLGYKNLASALRKSLIVLSIRDSNDNPSYYEVWVKKSEYKPAWSSRIHRIAGTFFKKRVGWLVPKSEKRALWNAVLELYDGFYMEVPNGDRVKIQRKTQPTA